VTSTWRNTMALTFCFCGGYKVDGNCIIVFVFSLISTSFTTCSVVVGSRFSIIF